MNIRFGIPKRVVESKEKFPNVPVLTMEYVESKGFNRRFTLNKTAVELLDLTPGVDSVIFAFDTETKTSYIGKNSNEDSILVGKNMAFSNKTYYDYICNMHGLDSKYDNYFELTDMVMVADIPIYKLKHIQMDEAPVQSPVSFVDREIEHLVMNNIGVNDDGPFAEIEEANAFTKLTDDDYPNLLGDEDEDEVNYVGKPTGEFIMNAF